MNRNSKVWEGERIPPGTVVGYQIHDSSVNAKWETVSEVEYYRALHNPHCLVFGRLILVAIDDVIVSNENGIIQPHKGPKP